MPLYRFFYIEPKGNIFPPVTGHCSIIIKDKIYVFGGIDDFGKIN
jgi:hypothetical protein